MTLPLRAPLRALCISSLLLGGAPASADAVSDALDAATAAYAAGDMPKAVAQITTAGKEIAKAQSLLLSAHFPAAPDRWTRSDNADMAEGLAVMGGGAGAEASYTDAGGMTVTLTAFADNMMVQSFAGILADPQMMAMMGKTVVINGVAFLDQEGQTTMALLENRVLLQANGASEPAQMLLGQIDLAKMGKFDAN